MEKATKSNQNNEKLYKNRFEESMTGDVCIRYSVCLLKQINTVTATTKMSF